MFFYKILKYYHVVVMGHLKLTSLAKWLSVRLRTMWLWVRVVGSRCSHLTILYTKTKILEKAVVIRLQIKLFYSLTKKLF